MADKLRKRAERDKSSVQIAAPLLLPPSPIVGHVDAADDMKKIHG